MALALGIGVTAAWAFVLLGRTPGWLPWLRWLIVVAGVAASVLVLARPWLAGLVRTHRGRRPLAALPLGLTLVAGLAGPAAYALDTVGTAHTGAIPSAGPATGFGGGPSGASGTAPGGSSAGTRTGAMPGGSGAGGAGGPGGASRAGGLGGDTTVSSALTRLLEQDASTYTWVAATEGSEGAAPLQLATGDAVMAIGGFNGTDPWPTLAVFKELVARHEIHYYVGQGSQSFGGGRGSSAIESWVAAHFKKVTAGGQTAYDLTRRTS